MARPSEIDDRVVVRMRDINRMPWDAIAVALGASRSGVVAAYARRKRRGRVTASEQVAALRDALHGLAVEDHWCGAKVCASVACSLARDALQLSD